MYKELEKDQKIFYGSPERLEELLNKGWFLESTLKVVVIVDTGANSVEILAHLSKERS